MTCNECDKIATEDIQYQFMRVMSPSIINTTYKLTKEHENIIECYSKSFVDTDCIDIEYDFCELVDEKTDELFIDARDESSLYNTFDVLCPYKQEYVKEEFGDFKVCGCNYPSMESDLLLVLKPQL